MKIANIHFRDTENVGDRMSSPMRYFPELFINNEVYYCDIRKPWPMNCDMYIFGGGALGNSLKRIAYNIVKPIKVAWGVGMTNKNTELPGMASGSIDLYGSRDWQQPGTEYAPCPSCMSDTFDKFISPLNIKRAVVCFWNADSNIDRPNIEGFPTLTNNVTFYEAIDFIASGETVLTNSYHGAYWAQLLERHVTICNPYSSKFYNFADQPHIETIDNDGAIQRAIDNAIQHIGTLDLNRSLTVAFFNRVMGLTKGG